MLLVLWHSQTFRHEAPKAEQTPVSLEWCLNNSQTCRTDLSSASNLMLCPRLPPQQDV